MAFSVSMLKPSLIGSAEPFTKYNSLQHRKRMVVVRAETINPEIRKTEEKVVDSVIITELSKNITPYCRFFFFFLELIFCNFC